MRKYIADKFDYDLEDVFSNPENNPLIVETAGFIPLDVKIKRFEQAGIRAQFSADEFTSSDYREMYMTPDFDLDPNDDLETVQEKLHARELFIADYKARKLNSVISDEGALATKEEMAESNVPNELLKESKELEK